LPACAGNGVSRIVPRLEAPSIGRDLADYIVTEHGVAQLKGLSRSARAAVLTAIAAPQHRPALAETMTAGRNRS
jgi:acyl-CoA hydrolase